MRVRLEKIRLGPNVSAGMNECLLLYMVHRYRTEVGDPFPAVLLVDRGQHWQIVDGRHRVFAAAIAGRADVLAVER